jgi:hypothetical protein
MSWGYVAVAAGTVLTGYMGSKSAKDAARAAGQGSDAATQETARQYDQTRADFAPYRVTGTGALNQLASVFGLPSTTAEQFSADQAMQADVPMGDAMLPAGATSRHVGKNWYAVDYDTDGDGTKEYIGNIRPGGASGRFTPADGIDINELKRNRLSRVAATAQQQPSAAPNMSGFFTSPGYEFRRSEGMRGIERTAAASGGAFSGNALKALADFNSNLASNEFGNYFNQLASIAGIGQTSTNATAAYGANAANSASRNQLAAGDARASGIIGQGNAWGNTVQDLSGLYGYWRRQPRASGGGMASDPYFGG